MMAIIRRSFTYLDQRTFILLYKSLVRPHLEYCNQIWSPHLVKHTTAIENVQRRATRQIPGLANLTYEERLRKLNLPTLAYRRLRGDMIEVYKLAKGNYDAEVTGNFLKFSPRTSRGHNLRLTKQTPHSSLRRYSFTYRVVNTWNSLPERIIQAPSVKSFEGLLDKFWANKDILYDHRAPRE